MCRERPVKSSVKIMNVKIQPSATIRYCGKNINTLRRVSIYSPPSGLHPCRLLLLLFDGLTDSLMETLFNVVILLKINTR